MSDEDDDDDNNAKIGINERIAGEEENQYHSIRLEIGSQQSTFEKRLTSSNNHHSKRTCSLSKPWNAIGAELATISMHSIKSEPFVRSAKSWLMANGKNKRNNYY